MKKITMLATLLCVIPTFASAGVADKSNDDIHVFVGLNASLLNYTTAELSGYDMSYKVTNLKLNYNLLENTGLMFGIDNKDGFRLAFIVQHSSDTAQMVYAGSVSSDTNSATGLGVMFDLPFIRAATTSPFFRLGLEHISVENGNFDGKVSGLGLVFGGGVTHNFSKEFFGTLSATYMLGDLKTSYPGLSYDQNQFSISLGLGYRF